METLGGRIVIKYAGQEHATPGWEREQLDKLLKDAKKSSKPFDAVIVVDPSRWSRDNIHNEQGLEELKQNGIRFFTLTAEHDLHDEQARFFLTMSAVINQYNARTTAKKSLLNRIERAKRGIPTSGDLPYGRTFDRKTGKWGITESEQKQLADIAQRYLNGEPMRHLAIEYGTSVEVIYLRLDRAGDVFYQRFKGHEPIAITVPRLLPDEILAEVKKKRQAQKTFEHGKGKRQYLLGGMICCGYCGAVLTGTHNNEYGNRYYRHKQRNEKKCDLWDGHVPADKLENRVVELLFDELGNPAGVQRAIDKAIPNKKQIEEKRQRIQQVQKELEQIANSRDRILVQIEKDTITEDQASDRLTKLKKREEHLRIEAERLREQIASVPDAGKVKEASKQIARRFRFDPNEHMKREIGRMDCDISRMTWDDKRHLLKTIFTGTLGDGRRMAVYVTRDKNKGRGKGWKFRIRGNFFLSVEHKVEPKSIPYRPH